MPLPPSTWSIGTVNGGVAARRLGRDHRRELEELDDVGRRRHADEPARPAQHEVDRVGGDPARRHLEVALVLAVLVVDDEDHLAAPDPPQCLVDRGKRHRPFLRRVGHVSSRASSRGPGCGQGDDHAAAVRVAWLGVDVAAVQIDDPAGDRETEPGAAVGRRPGRVEPLEPVEDAGSVGLRDPGALVEHLDDDARVVAAGAHLDHAPGG